MKDGQYRMWWCSEQSGGGDQILSAASSSLDGPWSTPAVAIRNINAGGPCDPAVVRANDTYYMYYDVNKSGAGTEIFVASSTDGGSTWQTLNNNQPIVAPEHPLQGANVYGAGQPSVIFTQNMYCCGGTYTMMYTDTTGNASLSNGAGQYVLRASDPLFQTAKQELQSNGFQPYSAGSHTNYSFMNAFSADWQYVDALDMYAVAADSTGGQTSVEFYSADLLTHEGTIAISGNWSEGPALVSHPDHHAVASNTCGVVPFDVMRSVSSNAFNQPSDIGHAGISVNFNLPCSSLPLGRVYNGSMLHSSGLPLAVVVGYQRVNFALSAPAYRIARNEYTVSSAAFNGIPYAASMFAHSTVLAAPGTPAAFQLDNNTLWPTSCSGQIADDQAATTYVSTSQWSAYPVAYSFFCLY